MPIPFSCPHCGLETLVDDEFAGESGECLACGKPITVPYRTGQSDQTGLVAARRQTSPGLILLLIFSALAAAALMIAAAVTLVFPALGSLRAVAAQRSCRANLVKIGAALRAYEAEHGSLPPAYIPDERGRPKHSWRVLILPQLDEHGLYRQYNFDEPWDGPTNSQLARRMPPVYGCPADLNAQGTGETNYMVVVGPGTFFPSSNSTRTADCQDPLDTTILVVETPVAGVNWLEPRDLKAERMQFTINDGFGVEMGSLHSAGAHVLMADGSVHFLRDTTPSDYLEGMTTIRGGEPIPAEVLRD